MIFSLDYFTTIPTKDIISNNNKKGKKLFLESGGFR